MWASHFSHDTYRPSVQDNELEVQRYDDSVARPLKLGTSTSVSSWMGDHQGGPGAVNLVRSWRRCGLEIEWIVDVKLINQPTKLLSNIYMYSTQDLWLYFRKPMYIPRLYSIQYTMICALRIRQRVALHYHSAPCRICERNDITLEQHLLFLARVISLKRIPI